MMTERRWQFGLAHAFVAMTLVAVLLGWTAGAGIFGTILFGGACGIVWLGWGVWRRDGRHVGPGLLLILLSAVTLMAGSTVAVGSGRATLPCAVRVVDAVGSPVESASVRIRDVGSHMGGSEQPVHPIPAGEPGVSGVTGADGEVTLAMEFRTGSYSGLRIDEAYVSISRDLWVQVDAPGYERELVRLDRVIGRLYDWDRLPLPQVAIPLKKQGEEVDRRRVAGPFGAAEE